MSLSMHAVAVPSFLNTLGALSKILDKAAAHCAAKKIDQAVLLQMRLAPDMFPFIKQVQLTCDFAKNTMGRLTGEPPKFPDEEKIVRRPEGAHRQDGRLRRRASRRRDRRDARRRTSPSRSGRSRR